MSLMKCGRCGEVDEPLLDVERDVNWTTASCGSCGSQNMMTLGEAVLQSLGALKHMLDADEEGKQHVEFLKDFIEGQYA